MDKIKLFLHKKGILFSTKVYTIDAMSAMAQGLFASLLIGTILSTIGNQFGIPILTDIGNFASDVKGTSMAVAIGSALSAPPLVLYSLLAVGYSADKLGGAGGPLAVYFIVLIACEIGKIVSKETKIDILITPAITILSGTLLSLFLAPKIGKLSLSLGNLIMSATQLQPLLMGIIVSVLVGIALTLPISSAAICAALGLQELAGGAALAGCSAQMIGFAVMSYHSNKTAGLVAQGIGTSMLQMGNIVRKPAIWIPPIIVSAITGPIATCIFQLEMNGPALASGMGTCGMVGPIGVYTGWLNEIASGTRLGIGFWDILGLLLISIVLPAILTPIIAHFCIKNSLFNHNDLKLNL